MQRFPEFLEEQTIVIAGIPREEIRHTRAVQDWLAEGRLEGEAAVTLRLLTPRLAVLQQLNHCQLVPQGLGQCPGVAASSVSAPRNPRRSRRNQSLGPPVPWSTVPPSQRSNPGEPNNRS